MTAERIVASAFLVISLLSAVVQTWALHRLSAQPSRGGVWRTVTCRVACAAIYIAVGLNALLWHWASLVVSLAAFCLTQGTWALNTWLDVRLERSHHTAHRPAHRYIPRERRFPCLRHR